MLKSDSLKSCLCVQFNRRNCSVGRRVLTNFLFVWVNTKKARLSKGVVKNLGF